MTIQQLNKVFMAVLATAAFYLAVFFVGIFVASCGSNKSQETTVSRPEQPRTDPGAFVEPFSTPSPFDDPGIATLDQWRWGPVHFNTGQHNIRSDQTKALDGMCDFLRSNGDLYLHVDGHADMRGSKETNRLLSRQRGEAVRDYLVRCGVKDRQILVFSYGDDRPTGQGYKADRRAEVQLQ